MRGVVELQWRDQVQTARKARRARHARRTSRRQRASRGRRFLLDERRSSVARERTLLTQTGMKGVQGGDPAGLSKAMCLIW